MSFNKNILFTYKEYSIIPKLFSDIFYSQLVIVCDKNTYQDCYPKIDEYLPRHQIIQIEAGESYKNLMTCQIIWEKMTEFKLDRKALIVNLGGGVLLDMLGFCTQTYKRGIRFLNIPTTLLSQVDASVGGKLGINFLGYKNHLGLFANPEKVWIDIGFLDTLDKRQFLAGFAEMIKHSLIEDKSQWDLLKSNLQEVNLESISNSNVFWLNLITYSVQIKANIVEQDPKEQGLRKILNFGHTIGHALESFYLYSDYALLHGEAVALGMIAETYISHQQKLIKQDKLEEIVHFILTIYPHFEVKESDISAISLLTLQDKKNENHKIQMTLLTDIGKAIYNQEVSLELIRDSLYYLLDKMK